MLTAFTRYLSRLSVGRKLLLIYLLDLTAVIYVTGILINEKYLAINFAEKELVGVQMIGTVREAVLAPPDEPLRSFLVPNTSITMTSTISQCQMLNDPMLYSCIQWSGQAREPVSSTNHARAERLRSPKDMDVKMIHLLPAHPAACRPGQRPSRVQKKPG